MPAMIATIVGINTADGAAGIKRPKSLLMDMTHVMDDGMVAVLAPMPEDFHPHADGADSRGLRLRNNGCNDGVAAHYTACFRSVALREPTRNPS